MTSAAPQSASAVVPAAQPKRTKRGRRASEEQLLALDYDLAELPSSQHRAGLAGLVLVIRWLERQHQRRGLCELPRVDASGATVRLDLEGLRGLFDEIYAAALEEQDRDQPFKNAKTKQVIPPRREEAREVIDQETGGKVGAKKVYIYPLVVPRGSFLADLDHSTDGGSGLWIKLWRDMLWNVFRGVPATRRPYEARAKGSSTTDADEVWEDLVRGGSIELPSTYFVGAQAATAENVPFADHVRHRFLLHFWPFVASVYCPALFDREGVRNLVGYALAVPDVSDLATFCDEFPGLLRARGAERAGYRPREAVVDLAEEGALDVLRRLASRGAGQGRQSTPELVLGIDVVHVDKNGNNVRILRSARIEPDLRMLERYCHVRDAYRDPLFRRQSLSNIIAGRSWFDGFDALVRSVPPQRTIESQSFRHDAGEAFTRTEVNVSDKSEDGAAASTAEARIYRLVGNYIARTVESKHQLRWEQVKERASLKARYEEAREKIAKDAFLAVRSRTGNDFVEYFTGTLCSVPQHVDEDGYLSMTRALLAEPDKIRTLTLLALSARG